MKYEELEKEITDLFNSKDEKKMLKYGKENPGYLMAYIKHRKALVEQSILEIELASAILATVISNANHKQKNK
jgi:hypothetical protein